MPPQQQQLFEAESLAWEFDAAHLRTVASVVLASGPQGLFDYEVPESLLDADRPDQLVTPGRRVRVPLEVKYGGESEFAVAGGVPMSVKGQGGFQTIPYGRFFESDSENACMLSLDFAKRINDQDPKSLVGQSLTLNNRGAALSIWCQ